MHCSVMGQEALEAAIYKYRGIEVEHHADDDEGTLICKCFGVTEPRVRRVIRSKTTCTTVEQVTNYIKAGGGCGSCLADIEDMMLLDSAERSPTRSPVGVAARDTPSPNEQQHRCRCRTSPSSPPCKKSP
jgi:NifU-like protein